jgi:hypothetical protein
MKRFDTALQQRALPRERRQSGHYSAIAPGKRPANRVLHLQQTIGNRAVQRLADDGVLPSRLPPSRSGVADRREVGTALPSLDRRPLEIARDEEESSDIRSVKVWLNAFIPKHIPGLTRAAPGHEDKTMIPGPSVVGDDPWFSDCFMTDQRSFDANVKASSRMHSEIEIEIGGPSENFQFHDCSPTHEIDCEDGGEECTKKGDTSKMKYSNLRGSLLTVIKVDLNAASNNPCYSGSPDIDYVGTVIINPAARVVDFEGKIDAFPAFEMYATANGGAGKLMFSEPPPEGNSPGDLAGPANRDVTGHAKI